jgi:hypothetical protein
MQYVSLMRRLASRIMPGLFCLWLIGATVRFASTVYGSLKSPFNPGTDIEWSVIWLTLIGLLIFSYSCFQTRAHRVTCVWIAAIAIAAVAVLGLSHTVFAFFAACWLVLISLGLGTLLIRTLIRRNETALAYIACGIPLGSALLALIIFVFGVLHVLTPTAIWILLAAGSFVAAGPVVTLLRTLTGDLRGYGRTLRENPVEFGIVLVIAVFVALLNLVWAVAPEVQFDALTYHLAVPKLYLQHSGIFEVPFYQAYFARLIEMVFAACLAVCGPEAAKLWVFLMSLSCVIALFALAKDSFNARVGVWACALFVTTPLVSWLSGTAYTDNIIALFAAASLLAVVRWYKTSTSGWLCVAAFLAGAAVGSKLTAALVVLPVSILVAVGLVCDQSRPHRSKVQLLISGIVAFGVMAVPTYALTYAFTGNPIFPLYNGIFQSPKWEIDNTLLNASQFGIPKTVSSLLRFPFRLTFDTTRFGEALPRGSVGLGLLLGFPFAMFFFGQKRIAARLLLVVISTYLMLLFYLIQYARYYVVVLPLVSIVGVATVFEFLSGRRSTVARICLMLALVMQPLTMSIQFWNIPQRFPIGIALGLEGREAFLKRSLTGYSAVEYLNTVALADETILGVDTENLRFYLRQQMETVPLSLKTNPIRKLSDMAPNAELAAHLKKLHVRHLFVMRSGVRNPRGLYPYLDGDFLKSHALLEFEDNEALVYRIL